MRRRPRVATVDGLDAPAELLDPDHPLWRNQTAYHAFMVERGWSLPAAERMGAATHPANRRQAAAAGWAEDNEVTTELGGHADWHRLRAMGLIQ